MKTLLLCLCLAGCAQDRYLSAEEDSEMRSRCEPVGGCALVPLNIFIEIVNKLRGQAL